MTNGVSVLNGAETTRSKSKSRITINEENAMAQRRLNPVHPGEVLLEEFLKPLNLSQNRLALDIGVPARRINEIVLRKRSVSADTALRLSQYFGTSPQFWLGLQTEYDLDVAADKIGSRIKREVHRRPVVTPSTP